MKARRTVTSNHVFSLLGGTEDNDLWVTVVPATDDDPLPVLCSTWQLSDEEREKIAAGENVELVVWGNAHPPVMVRTTNVPLGGGISREEVVERLRNSGNAELAALFEGKSASELKAEVETWPLPEDLRKEVLAFVMLLDDEPDEPTAIDDVLLDQANALATDEPDEEESDDPEWPFDDEDPPDPL